ncbi:NAD-glutamate dehydrogenase [Arthrobacter sp. CC3]
MDEFSEADPAASEEFRQKFFSDYYEYLAAEDVSVYGTEILESRALVHYKLAQERPSGTAVIGLVSEPECTVVAVTTDEMPYLVDSISGEIARQNSTIRLVVHPVLAVTRSISTNRILAVERLPSFDESPQAKGPQSRLVVESWISIEIDRVSDPRQRELLVTGLRRVLAHVRAAVEDGPRMRAQMEQYASMLSQITDVGLLPDLEQAKNLFDWLAAGNFIFLGYREYDLVVLESEPVLVAKKETGLGILRKTRPNWRVQHMTVSGQQKAREKRIFVINKGDTRSTVYRTQYLDYIGVKTFDTEGNVNGEGQFIGLFPPTAYTDSLLHIPLLRDKANTVLRESGFHMRSQTRKDLLAILESYPRDELFQIEVPDLLVIALGILHLQERRRTRLFLRPDVYGRFISAMIFLPRERYNSGARQRIQEELSRTFNAESVEFEVSLTESALARLFFRIWLPRGEHASRVDTSALEQQLVTVVRSWPEGVFDVLNTTLGSAHARLLAERWADGFPMAYRVVFDVENAVTDLNRFEARSQALEKGLEGDAAPPNLFVYQPVPQTDASDEDARVKLYLTEPKSLAQIIPVFQNLGVEVLDERPFDISTTDGRKFFLYDLGLKYPKGVDPLATGPLLASTFEAVSSGLTESDSLGRLILTTGISWQLAGVLRSYAKYMRQIAIPSSFELISDTLLDVPHIAQSLIRLFELRFDPTLGTKKRADLLTSIRGQLKAGLDVIETLDADRIVRAFINLIEASVRTNYFQNKPYLSIKFDSASVEGLPVPRPLYEIWVYSPRVEGVHLRFGKLARGGLRWSDRREDFRTEILGLVKAQTVKNAVIVPAGAKGGFFAKGLPATSDRHAWLAEGQHSYRTFIRGLLDITDNRVANSAGDVVVISPPRVVCHDGHDAYLVVAADKGTASFSDIANELSAEYGFWLGDAFASGGSVGYNHKAMGITARGAWESVKRQFLELNVDVQSDEFTVIGIGDMSGDVFGNGMLLSEHIRLLAAFDHRDIFLDPDPNPKISFAERRRLFDLPRSSWQDYDRALISKGGGIFPRRIKIIPVSEEVRAILGLDRGITQLSPPELLKAILRAPADLLYNAGIGTYVKASSESHMQVGDKSNDSIRVDGNELRVKVVVEGGNLGLTQEGRVEAALAGVLLNTDAIDNSAGVDCSDHEVNIKIFVDRMILERMLDPSDRAVFLAGMTDEVSSLVLKNNLRQNVLMAIDRLNSLADGPVHERLMGWLEVSAKLNRELEGLPSTTQLRARLDGLDRGLTAPELAVLAAYAKIDLARALGETDLSDDPWFGGILRGYFPKPLSSRFGAKLDSHPLARAIISTILANDMINSGGTTFAFRIVEQTSATESAVARAFVAICEIYDLAPLLETLDGLDVTISSAHGREIHGSIRHLLDRAVCWWINRGFANLPIVDAVDHFKDVHLIRGRISDFLQNNDLTRVRHRFEWLVDSGVPKSAAEQGSHFDEDFALLEICKLAHDFKEPIELVASVYFAVYSRFRGHRLFERISKLSRQDPWGVRARAALHDDLCAALNDVTEAIMRSHDLRPGKSPITEPTSRIRAWEDTHSAPLKRVMAVLAELDRHDVDDVASLWVALRMLRSLVQA